MARSAGRYFRLAIVIGLLGAGPALGQQDNTERELEKFRTMLKADPFSNPGNLYIDEGEAIWAKPQGTKNVSLEKCDLGKGPGKLEGAYAELPRFFADAGRVMDLESRLVWCMETLQGRDVAAVVKGKFSRFPDRKSDLEALSAFIANKSNGTPITMKLAHPKEQDAYAIGEALFYRRQGPMDFSCSTCHGENGQRIRLQGLAFFDDPAQAKSVVATWPAFRISQNTLRTMQHRMMDCYWQMRIDEVDFGSEATVALITYLTKKAEGGVIDAPGLKR